MIRPALTLLAFAAMAAATAPLAGCAYDYTQHTDRVSFRGGNAVAANLEAETTNPYRHSSLSTKGLGQNGAVTAAPAAAQVQ